MSAQSLVQQGYGGYAGWGDAEADADFKATGGSGKYTASASSSSGGGFSSPNIDPLEAAKKYSAFIKEQNQPLISQLQSNIPQVQKMGEDITNYLKGQVEPLKERYQSLISDITKRTQLQTSREFGKRGISTESGLYEKTYNETLNPELRDINLSQSQDLSSLMNQITQSGNLTAQNIMEINNAIAQAQTGNPGAAITGGYNWANLTQNQNQFNTDQELQKLKMNQPQTSVIESNGRKYLLTLDAQGNITNKQDLGSSSSDDENNVFKQKGDQTNGGWTDVTEQVFANKGWEGQYQILKQLGMI